MAGKGLFRMKRQMTSESDALSEAGSKQSAWSKFGMGLGGLVAMSLTGGAATPLVAGMMAGGGTLAGGLLGRQGAKKGWFGTDKAKIEGGRFYRDEAAKWKKDIGSEIWSGAGKAALTAGMMKLGSGLSYGKEGLKAAIPGKSLTIGKGTATVSGEGFKMGDIVKRGAETATYGDSLMEKLGKAIDFKGSFAGKGLQKLKTAQLGKEFADAGWIDPNLQTRVGGEPIVAMDRLAHSPIEKGARIDKMLQEGDPLSAVPSFDDIMSSKPSGRGFQKGILPGHSKVQYDVAQAKNAELVEALKEYQFGPLDGGPQPTSTKPLSSSLDWRDAGISPYDEYGSWGAHVGKSPVEVARELGEQGYGGPIQGESFPVTSPDFIRSDASRALGASQYSAGRISALDAKRHRDMLDSVRWHNRLFGD